MSDQRVKPVKFVIAGIIIVVGLIAFAILNPIVMVGAGKRAVVLEWGAVSERILDEGISWVAPIKNKVQKLDVKIQKEEREASASSKDLQVVTSKVAINYHLDPNNVNRLWQEVGKKYSDRVIAPAIEEFVKKTTAQYTAEELITKRNEVKESLRDAITENLSQRYIIVDDIFITDFDFSPEFNRAIESKVRAEQDALRAKNDLERVKMEAEQRVAQATAEAEAIRIQAEAVTQQGGKDYVQLKWVEAWASGGSKVPQYIVGDGSGFLFNMNK